MEGKAMKAVPICPASFPESCACQQPVPAACFAAKPVPIGGAGWFAVTLVFVVLVAWIIKGRR